MLISFFHNFYFLHQKHIYNNQNQLYKVELIHKFFYFLNFLLVYYNLHKIYIIHNICLLFYDSSIFVLVELKDKSIVHNIQKGLLRVYNHYISFSLFDKFHLKIHIYTIYPKIHYCHLKA